jgi:hypothetical protein
LFFVIHQIVNCDLFGFWTKKHLSCMKWAGSMGKLDPICPFPAAQSVDF